MHKKTRSGFAAGLILILIGGWFLAVQLVPGLGEQFRAFFDWPYIIIGVGAALLIFGLLAGEPGMAVPAAIVSGIGGILAYQNATGDWQSWSYIWTLIPGFVGVGLILAALFGEKGGGFRTGVSLLLVSAVLFLIFGSLMGANQIGAWWPLLLIFWGLWLLIQPIFRKRR